MTFRITENGNPTKGIYETFDEAAKGAIDHLDGTSVIEIRSDNGQVFIWKYDYELEQWVVPKQP